MERFWSKVNIGEPDECWEWGGTRSKMYGRFSLDGKLHLAHRVALELSGLPSKPGEVCRHSCDNPPCCNPAHLSWGTQRDNMLDAVGRARFRHSQDHPFAKLTDDQIVDIRRRKAAGESSTSIANSHNLTSGHVSRICTGAIWSHVDGPRTHRKDLNSLPLSVITDIRSDWRGGETLTSISEKYGVGRRAVSRLVGTEPGGRSVRCSNGHDLTIPGSIKSGTKSSCLICPRVSKAKYKQKTTMVSTAFTIANL